MSVFGADREAVIARELTKTFETVRRAPLAELVAFVRGDDNQQKGEFVVLIAGAQREATAVDERSAELLALLAQEMPGKQAAKLVARYTGLRRKDLYDHLLSLKNE